MTDKADKTLVVTAPLVVAHLKGGTLRHLYQGAEVPRDEIDPDHLKQLEDEGFVGASEDDKSTKK